MTARGADGRFISGSGGAGATSAGGVVATLDADGSGYFDTFDKAKGKTDLLSGSMEGLLKVAGAVGLTLTAGEIVKGAMGLARSSVELAANAEQTKVAFTTMLGSADAAKALIAQINSFAAVTPFNAIEVVNASRALLAFGTDADQIIPTLKVLGDVAAGVHQPIGDLAEIFGKAMLRGKLDAQDMRELVSRGIPVAAEFAKQFGVATSEVSGLVEAGQIGFPELQKALVSLTSEGGKFAGLMDAQSHTLAGVWSNAQDTIDQSLTKVGQSIAKNLDLTDVVTSSTAALQALGASAIPALDAMLSGWAANKDLAGEAASFIVSAAEWIAKGLGYLLGILDVITAAWKTLRGVAELAIGAVIVSLDKLTSGLVSLLNILPGVEIAWTETFKKIGEALEDEGLATLQELEPDLKNAGDRQKHIEEFFAAVRDQMKQTEAAGEKIKNMNILPGGDAGVAKAKEELQKLRDELDALGSGTKMWEVISKLKGLSPAELGEAGSIVLAKEAFEEIGKIDIGGPGVWGALDTFAAKMERINELRLQGAEGAKAAAAAEAEARKQLDKSLDEEARNLKESLKSPVEKAWEEIEAARALLEQGKITQADFDKAEKLAAAKVIPKEISPGFVGAGSEEAANLRARGLNSQVETSLPQIMNRVASATERTAEYAQKLVERPVTELGVVDDDDSNVLDEGA